MKCPIWNCGHELIEGSQKKFITWDEDICDPNREEYVPERPTFKCSNPECMMNKADFGFWDPMGSFYSSRALHGETYDKFKTLCKDNDPTAMDSDEKKFNAEKQKTKYLLNLYFWRFDLDYRSKADTNGKILGIQNLKLQCWKRNDHDSYTLYISGLHSLHYYFSSFYRAKKAYLTREYNENYWYVTALKEAFIPPKSHQNTKSWYRRLFTWYIETFEKKLKNLLFAVDIILTGEFPEEIKRY